MRTPRTTIRRKLILAIMLTSTTALALAGTALTIHEVTSLRALLARELATRAAILAANSTAALAFQNPEDASQVLAGLRTDPSIVAAALYDARGGVFATYPMGASAPLVPAAAGAMGNRLERASLLVSRPVMEGNRRLGSLFLRSDLRALDERVRAQVMAILVAVLGSMGVALALSAWLQGGIAQPVRILAETAKAVLDRKDYSVRARAVSDDELGVLAEGFNDMLAEIQRRDAELEQRVADRTAALEASNKELEAFSYSVSHDLRAPLRAIDGFSKALLEDCGDKLDQVGTKHLDRVRTATRQMGQLIDDLLNLARISRAELRRERFDLGAVGKEIAAELKRAQPEREGVQFVIAEGMTVVADTQLLRVVLDNLLRNAWKFTAKHPTARIELGQHRDNGHRVFFVTDDGAGFDMAHANLLFAPFQRLHRQRDFEGTGVGLATVQRIIHRHGGQLWADGAVERGASFSFTLSEAKS